MLDLPRNTATLNPPGRVHKHELECGGGYGKLCDGTQKSLSWDNILWITRTITKP